MEEEGGAGRGPRSVKGRARIEGKGQGYLRGTEASPPVFAPPPPFVREVEGPGWE